MRLIRSKLHDQQRANILLALVFFLLCLMVGGVILASASANAGQAAYDRNDEQACLTVSSAARLLRDQLQNYSGITITTVQQGTVSKRNTAPGRRISG